MSDTATTQEVEGASHTLVGVASDAMSDAAVAAAADDTASATTTTAAAAADPAPAVAVPSTTSTGSGSKRKRAEPRETCDGTGHTCVTVVAKHNLWNTSVEGEVIAAAKLKSDAAAEAFDQGELPNTHIIRKRKWCGIPVGEGDTGAIVYGDSRFKTLHKATKLSDNVLGTSGAPFQLRFYNLHYDGVIVPFVQALIAHGHQVTEVLPPVLARKLTADIAKQASGRQQPWNEARGREAKTEGIVKAKTESAARAVASARLKAAKENKAAAAAAAAAAAEEEDGDSKSEPPTPKKKRGRPPKARKSKDDDDAAATSRSAPSSPAAADGGGDGEDDGDGGDDDDVDETVAEIEAMLAKNRAAAEKLKAKGEASAMATLVAAAAASN